MSRKIDQIIWNEWSKGKSAKIVERKDSFVMNTMPFSGKFKKKSSDKNAFMYSEGGKHISFTPVGVRWDNEDSISKARQSTGSMKNGKVEYKGIFGEGINIEMSTSEKHWLKDITIDSLDSLGDVPTDAQFLEFIFEIDTDFDIDWDRETEKTFTEAVSLSEMSRIRPVNAKDSETDEHPACVGVLRVEDGKEYLIKQIPVEFLKTAVYPVVTDFDIAYGSEYVFNSATTYYTSCSALDSTHFVVAHSGGVKIGVVSSGDEVAYGSSSSYPVFGSVTSLQCKALDSTHFVLVWAEQSMGNFRGYSVVGTVSSGNVITLGSSYGFQTGVGISNVGSVSCDVLDSTHFVVGYELNDSGVDGICQIGSISNVDEVAYGSEYVFNSTGTDFISCSALDSTHFVVSYQDDGGSDYGCAKVGVVSSGDEITYGSEYVFNSAVTYVPSCSALDSTHFVVTYCDDGGSDYGCAKIGVVSSGDEIAYGSEYVFNSALTTFISCSALDSTHFVVSYRDGGNGYYGTAIIGTVLSGDEITCGPGYVFNSAATNYTSCSALDSTHFAVAYQDEGNSSYGTATIGTVSPGQITYGSEYVFNSATTSYVSCAALDSTHFVVAYQDTGNSSYGTAIVGTVSSGDEIAYGSEYVFNAAATLYISCSALDSTHFVVVYRDDGGDDYGCAKIGVVSSGNEIAYGAEYPFNEASTYFISCAVLDATHFVVGYTDIGNSGYGTSIIGVVSSGNQIAYGSEYIFNSTNTEHINCASLDSTHFIAGYADQGGDKYGCAKIGVVSSGDQIAYGSEYIFNSAETRYISCAPLDTTHFVASYQDYGNSSYGTAIIGVVSNDDEITYGSEYVFNSATIYYTSCSALDSTHFVVAYRDDGNIYSGTAVIGVVSSGDEIACGSKYVFNSATTSYVSCAALDSTHFAIGYQDVGNSSYGTAIIGTIPSGYIPRYAFVNFQNPGVF